LASELQDAADAAEGTKNEGASKRGRKAKNEKLEKFAMTEAELAKDKKDHQAAVEKRIENEIGCASEKETEKEKVELGDKSVEAKRRKTK